jgi:hypothetical protein
MTIFEINTKYSRNLWAKLDELQGLFQLDKFTKFYEFQAY